MAQSLSAPETICQPVNESGIKNRLIEVASADLESRGYTLEKEGREILVVFCRDFYFVTQSSDNGTLGGINYTFIDLQGRVFQSMILG
jgi:hypothetical protein